eukprot:g75946.t1
MDSYDDAAPDAAEAESPRTTAAHHLASRLRSDQGILDEHEKGTGEVFSPTVLRRELSQEAGMLAGASPARRRNPLSSGRRQHLPSSPGDVYAQREHEEEEEEEQATLSKKAVFHTVNYTDSGQEEEEEEEEETVFDRVNYTGLTHTHTR